MKIPVIVALDQETHKIWQKLPDQQKSATIRQLLRGFVSKEQPPPKHPVTDDFSKSYDNESPQEKPSNTPEVSLSEMAAIVNTGKKKSKEKQKASIAKRLTKASNTQNSTPNTRRP